MRSIVLFICVRVYNVYSPRINRLDDDDAEDDDDDDDDDDDSCGLVVGSMPCVRAVAGSNPTVAAT